MSIFLQWLKKEPKHWALIGGLSGGAFVVLVIAITIICVCKRRKKAKEQEEIEMKKREKGKNVKGKWCITASGGSRIFAGGVHNTCNADENVYDTMFFILVNLASISPEFPR